MATEISLEGQISLNYFTRYALVFNRKRFTTVLFSFLLALMSSVCLSIDTKTLP